MGCSYCYQKCTKDGFMGEQQKQGILNFIKIQNPRSLYIDYFGGEPLLNSNFMLRLNEEIKNNFAGGNKTISSSVTTNGSLLTRTLFEELLRLNVSYFQVTIEKSRFCFD